jgi:hypothetical protein
MSQERKKVEIKPVAKPEPVKRERPQPKIEDKPKVAAKVVKTKVVVKPDVAVNKVDNHRKNAVEEIEDLEAAKEIKKIRPKNDDKYVRYSSKDYQSNKVIISEKILKDEMKFAYFAIDGDDFYHYYILTKK